MDKTLLTNLGDITQLLIINTVSILILLRGIYYRITPNREFLFGFFMFGVGVFFVAYLLSNVDISMGFAFGLFAVFSMLRYRTESISLRDMTYLFLVITLSLLSAVGPISIQNLLIVNVFICIISAYAETKYFAPLIEEKIIFYDNIELLRADKVEDLMLDLRDRTGLSIFKVEIDSIDFLRDTGKVKVFIKNPSVHKEKSTHHTLTSPL